MSFVMIVRAPRDPERSMKLALAARPVAPCLYLCLPLSLYLCLALVLLVAPAGFAESIGVVPEPTRALQPADARAARALAELQRNLADVDLEVCLSLSWTPAPTPPKSTTIP